MPLHAQDDDRIMGLLDMALAAAPERRRACLEEVCGSDIELLDLVWGYVQAEQQMQGFLLQPLFPPPEEARPFEPGQILEDRFRIVREVARGGMGIVYEALDERLDRRIALKCAKPGFHKRLPPEVRNASEIGHPNVCRIYEIHTAHTDCGEVDFFTMEFLEGETLTEKIRRGPLQDKEARGIALQVCAGLAEAHRKEVIHGDLKCGNVIVTTRADGTPRAVITDFGLARRPGSAGAVARSSQAAGTPDYMAPELWTGAKPSVASDVYALGVLLRELNRARPAAAPGLPAQLGSALKRIRPTGLSRDWSTTLTAGVGAAAAPVPGKSDWDRVVARCTDRDPARRFASAEAVARALLPRARRWLIGSVAAAVLAIASALVTYQAATAPAERVRLAVLPFESPPETAQLAVRAARDVSQQLSAIRSSPRTGFAAIGLDQAVRKQVDTALAAGAGLKATHVLEVSFQPDGERVVLEAAVTDARSQLRLSQRRASYSRNEMRCVPVALAGFVTETFHLPALTDVAAVSPAAREDYRQGLAYLRRNSTVDQALPLLERAVATDPYSPLTHAAMAEGYWWKWITSNDKLWLAKSRESVEAAERRNPDLAAVRSIAALHKQNEGRYEQAVADLNRAIEIEPQRGDTHRRLGKAHALNQEPELALASYQRGVELDQGNYRNHYSLGAFHHQRGDYLEAARHLLRAAQLAPEEPTTHASLGQAYWKLGRHADAERELQAALALEELPEALISLGALLMDQGRDRESVQYYLRAQKRWPDDYLLWMNLGQGYRRLNLLAEARGANQRALRLAEEELRKNARAGYVRACLAYLCAWLGEKRRAEAEIAQALQLSPDNSDMRRMAVKTYEVLGQREASLAVLRESLCEVRADAGRYSDLADLHRDQRFQDMLAGCQAR